MEVSATEFRKNFSKYFDIAYFEQEEITLKKRWYKLKLIRDTSEDEKSFNEAAKSLEIRKNFQRLASKL
jgi:hypothetical protein